jgi:acyl dehydratase
MGLDMTHPQARNAESKGFLLSLGMMHFSILSRSLRFATVFFLGATITATQSRRDMGSGISGIK